jgi:hypothetical protein
MLLGAGWACDLWDWLTDRFALSWPIDLASAAVGTATALAVLWLEHALRRPHADMVGFHHHDTNVGRIHYLKVRLRGPLWRKQADSLGVGMFSLRWGPDGSVFGKWDELHEPIRDGRIDLALIPGTYFQPLFYGTTYKLPVLVEPRAGSFEVYSGWWYARSPDPSIAREGDLTTEVAVGAGERWRWTYKVWEIAAGAEHELGPLPDARGAGDEDAPQDLSGITWPGHDPPAPG